MPSTKYLAPIKRTARPLAEALGVSPLTVGLTVIAFGTSTPELVVNGLAAYRGETALAFGNIVGSCAINVGFVPAVTALVRRLQVETSLITREVPMLWVAVGAIMILSNDRFLDGNAVDLLSTAQTTGVPTRRGCYGAGGRLSGRPLDGGWGHSDGALMGHE